MFFSETAEQNFPSRHSAREPEEAHTVPVTSSPMEPAFSFGAVASGPPLPSSPTVASQHKRKLEDPAIHPVVPLIPQAKEKRTHDKSDKKKKKKKHRIDTDDNQKSIAVSQSKPSATTSSPTLGSGLVHYSDDDSE